MVNSCDFIKKSDGNTPIARVNENYLYGDDIIGLVSEGTSKQDSILLIQNFINRWATQQLFVDGAKLNLSEEKQAAFDKLVVQYKNDLYSKAYIEALVKRSIDTAVSIDEAEAYYANNKEVFKLNEELIKFRYIHLDENIINYANIRKQFRRYN
ncbi:peptidyl-prolyl cis-trans isomerase, partial [Algibacter sp.]|nr:peptidyl-prolyl cis-trans isomerase [Algibacter sp.]